MKVIEVEQAVVQYGPKPVLKSVNLDINQGDLVAVMGPNGMGKSTLINLIAGLHSPLRGEVKINGLVRRSSIEAEHEIRKNVAYLSDKPWLPLQETGRKFLWAMGNVYEVKPVELAEHIERLLQLFELDEIADQHISTYSNGQKKKIALASALVTNAPILILDEPFTGGIDPSGIFALKQVLKQLAVHDHRTVLMTSQLTEIVEQIADRIVILEHGVITSYTTLEETMGDHTSLANALEKTLAAKTNRVETYLNYGAAE